MHAACVWNTFSTILGATLYVWILLASQPHYDVHQIVPQHVQRHFLYQSQLQQQEQDALLVRAKRYNVTRIKQLKRRQEAQERKERLGTLFNVRNNFNETDNETLLSSSPPVVSEWVVFGRFLFTFVTVTVVCGLTRALVLHANPSAFGSSSTSTPRITRSTRQRFAWSTTTSSTSTTAARRREARQEAFRRFAQRLNRQRADAGERPLSLESLRLVLRNRDLTSGDDYEQLLRFDEEAGAVLFQSMGATQDEIERCPMRVLQEGDDLLKSNMLSSSTSSSSGRGIRTSTEGGADDALGSSQTTVATIPHCAVCLEQYELHDHVRTIPCFHTFHVQCIDEWLGRKAACPICKHPAVA